MKRNEFSPEFENNEYRVTINDRFEQGAEVAQVRARDQDEVRDAILDFWTSFSVCF